MADCEASTLIGAPETAALADTGSPLSSLWIVFGLGMGPVVALGLGRFAFALLLPSMRTELGWSFADAGAMSTANAFGYVVGALVSARFGRRFGDKVVFAVGLPSTALAIGASCLTTDYSALLALRLIAGIAGALSFVSGAGLTSAVAAGSSAARTSTLLGLYFAGPGLGIAASAIVVPPLLVATGWRAGWLALGGMALVATLLGWQALGRTPELKPGAPNARGGWSPTVMLSMLLAYGLFGAGYIAYATFIIAYLRSNEAFSARSVTTFWATLGLAAVIAAFAWGPILGRLKGGWGVAATTGVATIGAALPLVWPTVTGAYLSSTLFGGSFLAVVAAVMSFARRAAKPHALTAAIASLTITFGLGQCIGPVLTGALSDGPNGVRAGLWCSVGILIVSTAIACLQADPPVRH